MLPRTNRLLHSTRLSQAISSVSPFFIFKYAPTELTQSRVGIVVPKKVDKRAVKRNHLRRIITHTVQPLLPGMGKPLDMLFILKPAAGQASDEQLKEELEKALQKAGLL